MTNIAFDQNYSGTVTSGNYAYYSIYNSQERDILIRVHQSSTADVDLFVKYNSIPTYLEWDFKDVSMTQDFVLPIPSAHVGSKK